MLYLLINIVVVIAMRLLERGLAIPGYITREMSARMFANFDFDVIRRSLGYLFFDGMTFTLTLTGARRRSAAWCSAR